MADCKIVKTLIALIVIILCILIHSCLIAKTKAKHELVQINELICMVNWK